MLLQKVAKEIDAFNEILGFTGKGAKNVVGLTRPAKAHFAALLCKETKKWTCPAVLTW